MDQRKPEEFVNLAMESNAAMLKRVGFIKNKTHKETQGLCFI